MDNPEASPLKTLANAFRSVLEDSNTPETLRDRLILIIAQLRDKLPPEQARSVNAAEAEAVIKSFAS